MEVGDKMFGREDETSAIDVDGIESKVGIKGRTQDVLVTVTIDVLVEQ